MTFPETSTNDRGSHRYDIHGLVGVVSDTPLIELEAFRVPALRLSPAIEVSTGSRSNRNGRVDFEYLESPGNLGFALRITEGEPMHIRVSGLLRWSPHVLFTNVVEPILRWTLVEKGYALVHAACLARGEKGFLVTARTDTGKTSTVLKMLDRLPYEFLSDDLVLLDPDGLLLSYPKPLTISRHTARALSRASLSVGERVTLIYQSRLHSRTGRRMAFHLSKRRLPVATLNAVVQLLVPPPKYQIQRLVPGVRVGERAHLAGVFVIERSDSQMRALSGEEALATLVANSDDAYGFPPYSQLEGYLLGPNRKQLRQAERTIIGSALFRSGCPATLLRSRTMDWAASISELIEESSRERSLRVTSAT